MWKLMVYKDYLFLKKVLFKEYSMIFKVTGHDKWTYPCAKITHAGEMPFLKQQLAKQGYKILHYRQVFLFGSACMD